MTNGSEMYDSSGTAVAAQPRPEVVVRTVREVSGTSWPTLTRTNYGEWAVTMKVKLRARRLWNAVDKGTENKEDDMSALEAILAAIPTEHIEPLRTKSSATALCALLRRHGRLLQRCASVPTAQRRRRPSF